MKNFLSVFFLASIMASAFSCSKAPQDAPQAKPSTVPAATAQSAPKGRDISGMKACEIVTPDEAAARAGGKLLTKPIPGGSTCMYVLEVPKGTESYNFSIQPAAMYEALLSVKSEKEKGEKIPGLWEEAYLAPRDLTKGFSLIALKRGDIAIEVSGERKEVLLEIAKLAVSRIQ
ncbi:MAG: hypothetical protein EPN25_00865 [Nitrospirae bacterium]|nr:MAG: hypothetical protein EPN25_00865 [Nitrospirota bacterium]